MTDSKHTMKPFMDENFLLSTPTSQTLFHKYSKNTPIIDYHCHISPKEIAENRKFENITQVWLGGDHYKWRLMRSFGVDEQFITGKASDKEKFFKWAEVLGKAIGNPLYHWSHLELQRYFDYHGILNKKTAEVVWNLCNSKLAEDSMRVQNIIKKSNVKLICTTDDPVDSLEWHDVIAADKNFDVQVLPAWRPDKSMNIEKIDYLDYLKKLSEVSGVAISSFEKLKEALKKRMAFFSSKKCCVSDHGLNFVMYHPASEQEIESIFSKRLSGKEITQEEEYKFKTAFMIFVGREYHKLNWVMQLHYGAKRDNNQMMYSKLGPDTGYDSTSNYTPSAQLLDFMNALQITNELPKTIVYSLNPNDFEIVASAIGSFQEGPTVSKIQMGSAWWFNDHKLGMRNQLHSLANEGNLSGFVGMLTDSRSFLSYTRHEYFRRILCDVIGEIVENGEFPYDEEILSEIVKDISYYNAVRYFEFDLK